MLPDAEAVARRGAELIAHRARDAGRSRSSFTLAVSGGRTPAQMFRLLAAEEVPWSAVTIYQVDERIAPHVDKSRNLTLIEGVLPARVAAMPVEEADLGAAADRYAAKLPEHLDLVHLGLGYDGHTASLVPGDPVLDVRDRDVAITGEYQGHRRMTLTYPALDRAREALWVVTGKDKQEPLQLLLAGDDSIPAGRIRNARQTILADALAYS